MQTGDGNQQFNANIINYGDSAGEVSLHKIKEWLSAPDPWLNHDAAQRKHESGTGQWLLDSTEYKTWKLSSASMLWLSGKAGCGKTILCSVAIEDVRADVGDELAFFYFSFSDAAKQTLHGFVSSLLHQLFHRASVQTGLRQAYGKHHPNKAPTRTLEHILTEALAEARTTLVVDAMDEVPEADNVRRAVMGWLNRAVKNDLLTKILFTSRPTGDIEASVADLHGSRIALQAAISDLDIQAFVDAEIARHYRLRTLDEVIKAEILASLRERAKGVFRWAFCVLDALCHLRSMRPQDIRSTLSSFPSTLNETYDRMLQEIPESSHWEARNALRWLALTPKPMTIFELCQACVIDVENHNANLDNHISQEDLFALLGSLITVHRLGPLPDAESIDSPLTKIEGWWFSHSTLATVQLAHSSVQDYLLSNHVRKGQQHRYAIKRDADEHTLAQSCLLYLKTCAGRYSDSEDVPQFCIYIADTGIDSFVAHGETALQYNLLIHDASRMLWRKICISSRGWGMPQEIGNALCCSASQGWLSCTELLLRNGADPNQQADQYPGTPLLVACSEHDIDSMELLLKRGADPNLVSERWSTTALDHACEWQDANAVKLLLKHGASPNLHIAFIDSPLTRVCRQGNVQLVELLLDAGADTVLRPNRLQPFDQAVKKGHAIVVQTLLDRAAKSKARESLISVTNIETVIRECNLEMLSLFVRNIIAGHSIAGFQKRISADVLMLEATLSSYQKEIVETLNVSYEDQAITRDGRDRLLRVACGHADMANTYELRDIMRDITATDERTRTRITNLTVSCKRVRSISILLNSTAAVNAVGGVYGSALRIACLSREERLMSIMLGAHEHPRTILTDAFLLAVEMGELEIVRDLIIAGADVNARGADMPTALQGACLNKNVDLIRLLVENGAETALRTRGVQSADEMAQDKGYESVRDLLKKNGVLRSPTDELALWYNSHSTSAFYWQC